MRRSVRRNQVSVALFPFLAVLICTMGALIVLLVLMVQQARVHARSLAAQEAAGARDDEEQLRLRLEEAQWRREMLEQSRGDVASQMADTRAKLAHLEEHIERLKEQARTLLARAQQIDEGKQPLSEELESARAELARLQAEIERKERELDKQRQKLASQERWYALIPYEGPNRTRRRPIYIECTERGIIIQPEGLVLTVDDFNGPLTAGNPLDVALRSIREHLQRTTGGQLGEPYPLLVVRPSGVVAYSAARAALKSWDDEFGYELVSEDKKLVFGTPDPVLASQLEKTVAVARQRQAAMIAMMPRRYQNDEPLRSFAADEVPGLKPESLAGGRGIGGSGGGGGTGLGANPPVGTGITSAGPGGASDAAAAANAPQPQSNPFLQSPAADQGAFSANSTPSTNSSRRPPPGAPAGASPLGSSTGNIAGPQLMPPGNAASGASSPPATASSNAQGGSSASKGALGSRKSNWALEGASPRSTAVTRPIHIAILADRIVLVPERGIDRPPQHLPASPQLSAEEIDRFVSAVQREMKSWGIAVANGYWKPVLQMEVAPDAEHHFSELWHALEGSGFDIERKQP